MDKDPGINALGVFEFRNAVENEFDNDHFDRQEMCNANHDQEIIISQNQSNSLSQNCLNSTGIPSTEQPLIEDLNIEANITIKNAQISKEEFNGKTLNSKIKITDKKMKGEISKYQILYGFKRPKKNLFKKLSEKKKNTI